jgi:hypothetical protein
MFFSDYAAGGGLPLYAFEGDVSLSLFLALGVSLLSPPLSMRSPVPLLDLSSADLARLVEVDVRRLSVT